MKMHRFSTNWQTVDIAEIYEIHKAIIKRAGTKAAIRDFSLLHSAIERPKATFGGKDHTTVMHAVQKVERLLSEDSPLRNTILTIEQTLQSDL